MNFIINTAYSDFWIAMLITFLIFSCAVIWVLIKSRNAVKDNIEVVFTKYHQGETKMFNQEE